MHGALCSRMVAFGRQNKERRDDMEFIRKKGYWLKTKPQIVGEICQKLEEEGRLTPKELVNVSRDVNAPLHNEFEWNDGVAAERYREYQAGRIIQSVAIKVTTIPSETTKLDLTIKKVENTVRYFHAVERDGNGYESLETICNNEEKFNNLMELCLKDMQIFRDKYYTLRNTDYAIVFDAIDEIIKKGA